MNNQDEKLVLEQEAAASEKKALEIVKNKLDIVCNPMGEFVWNVGEKLKNAVVNLWRKGVAFVSPLPEKGKNALIFAMGWCKDKVIAPVVRDVKTTFSKIGKVLSAYKGGFDSGNAALKEAFHNTKPTLIKWGKNIVPFVSVALCACVIAVGLNLNFVLKVEYDGEFVGYIDSESTFDAAKLEVNSRVALLEDDEFIKTPTYKLAVAGDNKVIDADQLTDNLIMASSDTVTEASGLYVGGKFMGAVEDGSGAKQYLSAKLQEYESKYPDAVVTLANDTKLNDGLYPNESLISYDEMMELIKGEVQTEKIYYVKKGDTLSEIANDNGLTTRELMALNPGLKPTSIHSGDKVILQASEPLIRVQVVYTSTYQEKIAYSTKKTPSSKYNVGYSKTTTKGVNGLKEVTAEITLIDGEETNREILAATVLKEPVTEQITYGTRRVSYGGSYSGSVSNLGTGRFKWPVGGNGGYISCYLYGYYGHTGIDIAAPKGTPIYAADSGTVVKAVKQSYGYGWHIIIDHGNGYTTYYAHNSALYVSPGQTVTKGQHIASMGRTGNATGNHLHFEVRYYGKVKNPLDYL